jgi:hypothetical protein
MSELIVETRKVKVGIKKVEEFEIYPLSFGQQRKFAAKIGEMISEFAEKSEDAEISTVDMVNMIMQLIEDNIVEIVKMVADYEIDLDNITNDQVVDIANHIYEMNYEGSLKNMMSLKKKVVSLWT